MSNVSPSKMSKAQLLALVGELAELAGVCNAVTENVLALAQSGRPVDRRTLERLIDELAALHARAAQTFGVGWPQIVPLNSPLRNDIERRLTT